jgi:hypothetical protein
MKVYIGPYPTDWIRCTIHSNYMQKKYGYDWPSSETKFEKFLENVEDGIQEFYNVTINKILCHRKRKVKIRIDRHDTWSMDHDLSLIILPMLKQIQKSKQGSPCIDDEDVPEHLRSINSTTKDNEWDSDSLVHDRWNWVLSEMIWAFEQLVNEDSEEQFHTGVIDYSFEKQPDGHSIMVKGPNDTHVYDREGHKLFNERISNGLILFGKYYRGLWD